MAYWDRAPRGGSATDCEPITLLLPGGAVVGVAFQTGALIALEDVFREGFRAHVRSIIGSSAGAVTGSFLSLGMTPEILLKSLTGRFPDEVEYFDPSLLLHFDRGRVPNPFRAMWRSLLFLLADLTKSEGSSSVGERRRRHEDYLRRVEAMVDTVPKGWFSLRGLERFLRAYLSGRHGRLLGFDDVETDLFVCATDLTRGRAVLFGKKKFEERVAHSRFFSKHQYITGESLLQAILCSSAIPFLFVPHAVGHEVLADGDARNTAAVGVAKALVGARFMVTINPLIPLEGVDQEGSTSELFLQALLTALEGNVVATLKLEFEEKYYREAHGEDCFDIIYFRPSPEDMRDMTKGSIVNLFSYQPLNVLVGYRSVFHTMRNHPAEARSILGRYGYSYDLSAAERRCALLEEHRHDPAALEDALLIPKHELVDR
jgi:predicted acylesterase/phospholipase RssA